MRSTGSFPSAFFVDIVRRSLEVPVVLRNFLPANQANVWICMSEECVYCIMVTFKTHLNFPWGKFIRLGLRDSCTKRGSNSEVTRFKPAGGKRSGLTAEGDRGMNQTELNSGAKGIERYPTDLPSFYYA